MKKKWVIGILLVCLCLVFVFFLYRLFSFPAKEYAKALMDAMYQEDFEDYMELTGESRKKVEALYKEGIANQAQTFKAYFGIDKLTTQGEEQLEEFVKLVYGYAKYDVSSVKKENGNQRITIEIIPIAFYKLIDTNQLEKEFRQKTENGEYLTLSEEEYQTEYLNQILERFEKVFEDSGVEYLDTQKYSLMLRKVGKEYLPSDEDFAEIDKALIAFF